MKRIFNLMASIISISLGGIISYVSSVLLITLIIMTSINEYTTSDVIITIIVGLMVVISIASVILGLLCIFKRNSKILKVLLLIIISILFVLCFTLTFLNNENDIDKDIIIIGFALIIPIALECASLTIKEKNIE